MNPLTTLGENQMEEEEDTSPPFWTENGGRCRLRRSYSLFLRSSALVVCVLVIALALTLVLIPTLQSFTTNILKPNSVKKSWDSLNLVLILFAILCGFLNKNTSESFSDTPREYEKPNPPTPPLWYEDSDPTPYNRLRSFNSYPDLRQDSPWLAAEERCRFYDDTHVNGYRGFDSEEESIKERRREQNKELKGKKKKKQRQGSVENLKSIISLSKTEPVRGGVATSLTSNKREDLDFYGLEENVVVTGNESPLIPIPPPPPPPFKMPAWRFRVQGDFVRIDSISSTSSGLPDLEDEVVDSISPSSEVGGESEILLLYPIPTPSSDVDTKAGTFIQRFRPGLWMEEKQGIGTSNLRPS